MADVAESKVEAAEETPAPTAAPTASPAVIPSTVKFEHRFFNSFPDLFFYLPEMSNDPVAVVKLGDNEVSLGFKGIKVEFNIPDDSPDAQMMDMVAQGLSFVNGLRIGDPIPKEVLTREASWEPSDLHYQIAYSRLTLQLATWMAGKENIVTNPEELMQLADDPQTKQKVNAAFEEAAEKIGLGRDRKEEVIDRIEHLSKELAYIEALRDKAQNIVSIEQKIQTLRRLYGLERSMLEIVDPCARLAGHALNQFKQMFVGIDQQTAEILAVLKNLDATIDNIRVARDDLHRRLMAWDEVFAAWSKCKAEVSEEAEDLVRETYRFLAPRFLQVTEWALVTKLAPKTDNAKKPKTRVLVRGEKPLTRIRKW
jgi:hypothetical protein